MKVERKKRIAILIILVLLINIFSPYSILLNKVQAASGTLPDPVVVFNKIQGITEKNGNKFFKVQIAVVGDVNVNGIDVQLTFDNTKIQPANKTSGKSATAIGMISEVYSDMADGSYGTKTYDSSTNTFRIQYAKGGGHDLPELGYSEGEGWNDVYDGYDTWAAGFDYYLPIITYTFRLVDTTLTDDDITTDLFELKPIKGSLPTGAQIVYYNQSGIDVAYNIDKISGVGFAKPSKTIDSIAVKTNPTTLTYDHGDIIDLTGGEITVTYSDGSTEDVSMTDSRVSLGSSLTADVNNPIVQIKFGNKTNSFNITVKDPVNSLIVKTPMSDVEYDHGEKLDFTGLTLEATTKSGATAILTPNSVGVTTSETTASVDSSKFTQTSAIGDIPKRGLQNITFEYGGKSVSQTIIVNDTVNSIELLTQPTKTVYKRGENLDLSGSSIKVNLGSGTNTTINLPDGNVVVSTYSPITTGTKQNLTVAFAGKVAANTIDVEAYDYITSSELIDPTKCEYNIGENLSVAGGNLKFVWHSGNITNINLTTSMVSGFVSNTVGTQNLTVTYTPVYTLSDGSTIQDTIIKTFEIEVVNEVTGVTITAPTKTTYNHGDNLDLAGGKITLTYTDGTTTTEPITSATITEADGVTVPNMSPSNYDTTNKVSKTLKLKYTAVNGEEGTALYPITIINDVKSITVHTTPKTNYNVNETLDISKGEIKVTRAVGTPEIISMTDSKVAVTGFNSTVENTSMPLIVTFTENGITQTTTYNVSVKDTVTSIAIGTSPKTNYKYGENLELTGATIDVVKGSGTISIPVISSMVSGYDPNTVGNQTVTITYGGETTTFIVNVKDYVTGITVTPSSVAGEYNDELSTVFANNNVKYTVTYAKAGAKTPISLVDSMVTGYNKATTIAQNLTVTYIDKDVDSFTNGQTFNTTLKVTLTDGVTGIAIKNMPNKTTYGYSDTIDLTSGKITITRKSGTKEDKSFTEDGVSVTETDGSVVDLTNVTFGTDNTAKKTIKISYEGESITFDITVVNKITGITIKQTPKTNYELGDSLDISTGTIEVIRENGAKEEIPLSNANVTVTGFDSSAENTNLTLNVKYTENRETKETSYTASVIDVVSDVQITTIPKTNYKYGENLDVTQGVLTITRNSRPETIPVTENMVTEMDGTPFDSTRLGTRQLKVTYGGFERTYEITVSDYVTSIILTPPTKLTYEYNESLDLTGGSVQKIMASGNATTPVTLNDTSVTLSTFNSIKIGAQTISVTYEGFTENFAVIVEDNIQSIEIKTLPSKVIYKYGESLDVTGGKIETIRSSGSKDTISMTLSMVSGYNPNTLGIQSLTVTYNGKTTTYDVTVEDYIENINITKPKKLIYKIGETIDLTGGKVNLTMASGTTLSPIEMSNAEVTVTGFDTSSEGAKTITVSYKGFEKTFGITVVDELSNIVINTLPNKLDYLYGEELDLTGGTIKVVKESGANQIINITKDMVSGYNKNVLGNQTLIITYEGFTQEFIVNVEDYAKKLEIKEPEKVEYEYGESLDLTGGKVSIIMASGKVGETAEMTGSMVSEYDKTKEGIQTIKIKYKDLEGKFQVKVVDKVKAISMNTEPNKVEYKYGETLDITGATIKVVKSSGIKIINVTENMVSGYDSSKPGTQVITVTYEGFTTKFIINMAEQEIVEEPNTPEVPTTPVKPEKPRKETKLPEKNQNLSVVEKRLEQPETPMVDEKEKQPETPMVEEKEKQQESPTVEKEKQPKATVVDKEKTEKNTDEFNKKQIAKIIMFLAILFLVILLLCRRNVKVYVEEDGEYVLGGFGKISSRKPKLNIDKYLDEDTYNNKVKIKLANNISKKIDGMEIEIIHRGEIIKHKVKYNGESYVILLKEKVKENGTVLKPKV